MALSGLDSALSGLRVAQQQLTTISNNVSNVGTPGYTRKILPQSAVSIQGETIGVRADKIIRKVDMSLTRDLWTQVSTVSFLETKATYLNRVQEFHGNPDLEVSVAAEVSELRDVMAALADSPEDPFLQRQVVNQAETVASRVNGLAGLLSEMRNDAQRDIANAVAESNQLLAQISDLNKQIKVATTANKTTAALEDLRDDALQKLAGNMDISFFTRGDGVLVVQTRQGVQLADERAETIYFNPGMLGPDTYYDPLLEDNGLYVGGNPQDNPNAIRITDTGLGGKIGALVELRDETLPVQQAQLDELAHKLAMRMDAQGLRLFTDASGQIPADTAPVPNPPGPLTPVEYVGFANEFRVNPAVLADNSLVQTGTVATDVPMQQGSNEVIRRVMEFAFGDVEYQEAVGAVDLRSNGTGAVSMQEWLGLYSQNSVTSRFNLSQYSDIASILAAGDIAAFGDPQIMDAFTITFSEARTGLGPTTIDIDLSVADTNFPIGAPGINDALDQIVAEINNQITLLGVPAGLDAAASRNAYGQLVITSRGEIEIGRAVGDAMTEFGLEDVLGLDIGSVPTKDPYIEIQVGNDPPVRVTIEPGDTEVELMDKLEYDALTGTGVPGLRVEMDALTGFLTLRPGNDAGTEAVFGGDIKITSSLFTSDGTGGSGVAAGASIIEALFGTASPINDVEYATTMPFRTTNLGPGVSLSTGVISSTNLIEYAQKMVNRHAEEINMVEASQADEASFKDLLANKRLDQSGVNIDEEMSNLIVVQTAYAAAARAVTAIDTMFQELLNAVRR